MINNGSILRQYSKGVSKKSISEKAGVIHNTMKKYIRQYIAMNRPLEDLKNMSATPMMNTLLSHNYFRYGNLLLARLKKLLLTGITE